MEKTIEQVAAERDEALAMLKEVLDSYKHNERKGIGFGPLIRAGNLLRKYGLTEDKNNG